MSTNIKNLFFTAFVAFALLAHPAFAQDTSFRRVQLAYGISLDVPSHWTVLSLDNRKNLDVAGQAMTDNAGIEGPSGRKESLLAMNSVPNPTGAMIRVSVTSPSDFTQDDLAAATPGDLKELCRAGIARQCLITTYLIRPAKTSCELSVGDAHPTVLSERALETPAHHQHCRIAVCDRETADNGVEAVQEGGERYRRHLEDPVDGTEVLPQTQRP